MPDQPTVDLDALEALAARMQRILPGWDLDRVVIRGAMRAYIAAADPATIRALIARLRAAEAVCEADSTLLGYVDFGRLRKGGQEANRRRRAALTAWRATR